MNGAQDLGGTMGHGPIRPERNEPLFHAPWERRVLGFVIAAAAAGKWNLDMSRCARESLPPAEYLSSSYYEIWAKGLEKLLVQTGMVSEEELRLGKALTAPVDVKRVLRAEDVPAMLARGGPTEREPEGPPRFAVGDRVVTRNMHPKSHTRLPRYARDKEGVIERINGVHVFADSNAHGQGETPQWLYTVRFSGRELWGEEADANLVVSIDAWETYLEPA
jgi:nitrile hydratase